MAKGRKGRRRSRMGRKIKGIVGRVRKGARKSIRRLKKMSGRRRIGIPRIGRRPKLPVFKRRNPGRVHIL